jgi:hypothetical protein
VPFLLSALPFKEFIPLPLFGALTAGFLTLEMGFELGVLLNFSFSILSNNAEFGPPDLVFESLKVVQSCSSGILWARQTSLQHFKHRKELLNPKTVLQDTLKQVFPALAVTNFRVQS